MVGTLAVGMVCTRHDVASDKTIGMQNMGANSTSRRVVSQQKGINITMCHWKKLSSQIEFLVSVGKIQQK